MFHLRVITFFIIILTIGVVVVGSTYYHKFFPDVELTKQLPELQQKFEQGKHEVITRSGDMSAIKPLVLGIQTEAKKVFRTDTEAKPVHQKALEYAQYQYCQQMVKEYEDAQQTSPSPSDSSSE